MKLKTAAKFRYTQMINASIIYYIVIIFIQIGKFIAMLTNKTHASDLIQPEVIVSSAIFLFVCGLNSFKPELKMMLQNGLTRQDAHNSFILLLPVTVIFSVIDTAVYYLQFAIYNKIVGDNLLYDEFAQMFEYSGEYSKFTVVLLHITFSILIYITTLSLGYMISAVFYRLNKLGKIIVPISGAGLAVLATALGSLTSNNDPIGTTFFMAFIYGSPLGTAYPNHFVAAMIMMTIIFVSVAHLLIRKAPVKK